MSEQTNAELIAVARSLIDQYDPAFAYVLKQVTDRLEAAEKGWGMADAYRSEVEQERDQIAAVVEKVRAADSASSSWDHFGHLVMDILATAPADALREHDASVRAEALREARDAINTTRNVPSLITLADKFGGYHQGERAGLEMAEDIIDRIEREAGLK